MEELKYLFALAMGFMLGLLMHGVIAPWIKDIRKQKTQDEEKEYPCATCLRWEECNGADEECPMIIEE